MTIRRGGQMTKTYFEMKYSPHSMDLKVQSAKCKVQNFKTLLLWSVFFLVTLVFIQLSTHVLAASPNQLPCYAFEGKVLPEKILPEQKKFQENIDRLLTKPDVSPAFLVETGITAFRIYHAKLRATCDELIQCLSASDNNVTSSGNQEPRDLIVENFQQCHSWVDTEIAAQKRIFSQFMLSDASRKKTEFIVNKYRDLNRKMRDLIDTLTFIQGKAESLFNNVGGQCARVQFP